MCACAAKRIRFIEISIEFFFFASNGQTKSLPYVVNQTETFFQSLPVRDGRRKRETPDGIASEE